MPPRLHLPLAAADPRALAALARDVRATGCDGMFLFEGAGDVFVQAAAVAQGLGDARLSTQIAVAFARNPMTLAYAANDLQLLTGGRFALGLGAQIRENVEERYGMPWAPPVSRMREYIQAIRAIFDNWYHDVPLHVEGRFVRHTRMQPMFRPARCDAGPPPVWLAAVGPAMTALAAECADGFVVFPLATGPYFDTVTRSALAEGRARRDDSAAPLELIAQAIVCVSDREEVLEQGRQRIRAQIGFYASTPAYAPIFAASGLEDLCDACAQLVRQQRWQALADAVFDDVVDAFAVLGPPKQVARKLHERLAWADDISLMLLDAPDLDALSRLVASWRDTTELSHA
ncbi:MAG: TIGR03617 family F420-dependent LLM class oxidoreductase [Candidatus Dadabacteria bacterium]|nr:MAG: TIGR03617 family F420-dependent LLM class oxidoreductase [Candidatus Dadabacteria bacterium]